VEVIKSEAETYQSKIDVLGWLARYSEFVTLPMITQIVVAFKETLVLVVNPAVRNSYI
jgi:hypothetical protein